jgi:thermitase
MNRSITRPLFYILPLISLVGMLGMAANPVRKYQVLQTDTPITAEPNTTITPSDTVPPDGSATLLPTEITPTDTPVPELTDTPTEIFTSTQDSVIPTQVSKTPEITQPPIQGTVELLVAQNSMPFFQTFSFNSLFGERCQKSAELAKIGVIIQEVPIDNLDTTIDALKSDPNVQYVGLNGDVHAMDLVPNDPYFNNEQALQQIRAPQGWEYNTGSTDVTIAVIDSGVDFQHPDLKGKVQSGCDFVNEDTDASDDNGHGTHVSGIAAAIGNDNIGIAGVSWGAQILPVKVLDGKGDGKIASVAAGIIWAADHGVQIINLSLGTTSYDLTLNKAIEYAVNNGVLVVASAGNSGNNSLMYPARFDGVIAVGSVTSTNQHSSFSNYGSKLDLVAPGENIYSSIPGNGYGWKTGTSMSAPFVSGLAAVLWGIPGNGRASRVEKEMEQSAQDLGVLGWDSIYGYGLIRMDYAIRGVLYPATATSSPKPKPTHTSTQYIPAGQIVWTSVVSQVMAPSTTTTLAPSHTQTETQIKIIATPPQGQVVSEATIIAPSDRVHQSNGYETIYFGFGLLALGAICLIWYFRRKSV